MNRLKKAIRSLEYVRELECQCSPRDPAVQKLIDDGLSEAQEQIEEYRDVQSWGGDV